MTQGIVKQRRLPQTTVQTKLVCDECEEAIDDVGQRYFIRENDDRGIVESHLCSSACLQQWASHQHQPRDENYPAAKRGETTPADRPSEANDATE